MLPPPGNGTGFGTYVGVNGPNTTGGPGFRALSASESYPAISLLAAANVSLSNPAFGGLITGALSTNSMILNSNGGFTSTGPLPGGNTLTPSSGGILALAGNGGLNGGQIAAPGTSLFLWTPGAATNLNLNSAVTGAGGITKDGAGTVTVGTRQLYTGTTSINNGTLKLSGGDNRIFVSAVGGVQAVNVNNGGTLDLNGTNQAIGTSPAATPPPTTPAAS